MNFPLQNAAAALSSRSVARLTRTGKGWWRNDALENEIDNITIIQRNRLNGTPEGGSIRLLVPTFCQYCILKSFLGLRLNQLIG